MIEGEGERRNSSTNEVSKKGEKEGMRGTRGRAALG